VTAKVAKASTKAENANQRRATIFVDLLVALVCCVF